jgi:virginiamycin A acetyltransferase
MMLSVKMRLSNFIRKLRRKSLEVQRIPGLTASSAADLEHAEIRAEGMNIIGRAAKVSGSLSLGYGTTIGIGCQIFGGTVEIGRYCQLGPYVGVYALNHPTEHLTLYVNRQLFDGRLKIHQKHSSVKIGNDVWVGHGAVILPGVKIGDGVVIGAGAVVTKDIEDYSIAVGNPAKAIKRRFDDDLIEKLQRLKWWNMTPKELQEKEGLFHEDFVGDSEKMKEVVASLLDSKDWSVK